MIARRRFPLQLETAQSELESYHARVERCTFYFAREAVGGCERSLARNRARVGPFRLSEICTASIARPRAWWRSYSKQSVEFRKPASVWYGISREPAPTRSANTEHGELQAFMVNLFAFYLWPSRNTLYAIVAADKWVTS